MLDDAPFAMIAVSVAILLLAVQLIVLVSLIKKCPPNQAMIISGLATATDSGPFKIVTSGAAVVLPVVQQVQYISMDVRTIQIKTDSPLISADGQPLQIELSTQIKIKSDYASIARAVEVTLGKSADEVNALVSEQVLSKLRNLIANLPAEQFKRGFDVYAGILSEDLAKLGFECLSMALVKVS